LNTFSYTGAVEANDAQIPNFAPGTAALKALNNFYVVGPVLWPTPTSTNPALQAFYKALNTYAPGTRVDGNTLQTYAAFQLFKDVAEKLPVVNSATVLKAFTDLSTPIDTGVIGPYSVVGKSHHIYNNALFLGRVINGTIIPATGKPINLSTLLGEVGAQVVYP